MAKRTKKESAQRAVPNHKVKGLRAEVLEQPITETLEINYMPYAMSVIISRAIPEIDGLKPSHRKLLYTMYQMKLLSGARTKSANVVGSTMKLNPHGDAAIYDTMVRLSRGYGALLHPLVDSKGNFGKVYSRDMAWAASRYTEVKLDAICQEFFKDIDKDTVDFVDNYDGSLQEPTLLPTTFPNVLVSANQGIAVGMASNVCGFHLGEVCDAAIAKMKNPQADILPILKAPDFPTGGQILYEPKAIEQVYQTGRGSLKVRGRWRYIKAENLIEIYEIPYSTTAEAIMDKVSELVKAGKVREITDMRDETDLSGLKLTIDLKRGTDPDKLMSKLYKMTPLQDSYPCNFNILIDGTPKVMGVGEILDEWIAWRMSCVRRRAEFDRKKKQEKLHLLKGLKRILLDIDRAVRIIRETELDVDVIPNLMIGFGIDQLQAEYVADIKLRNINREYLLRRTEEVDTLEEEIEDLQDIIDRPQRVKKIIISELQAVKKKYDLPRRTEILYDYTEESDEVSEEIPDYPVHVFLSQEGYFKKITPQSLRMASEQKYKEGDSARFYWETTNSAELLVFTDRQQCYKTRMSDFADAKASILGDYLPSKLGMDEGESVVWACLPEDYSGSLLFLFENGKVARVELSTYQTKTKRKKLANAYSDASPLKGCYLLKEDCELVLYSTENRALILNTAVLAPKTTRNTQGVAVLKLKPKYQFSHALTLAESLIVNDARYRARTLPALGGLLKPEDKGEEQLMLGE